MKKTIIIIALFLFIFTSFNSKAQYAFVEGNWVFGFTGGIGLPSGKLNTATGSLNYSVPGSSSLTSMDVNVKNAEFDGLSFQVGIFSGFEHFINDNWSFRYIGNLLYQQTNVKMNAYNQYFDVDVKAKLKGAAFNVDMDFAYYHKDKLAFYFGPTVFTDILFPSNPTYTFNKDFPYSLQSYRDDFKHIYMELGLGANVGADYFFNDNIFCRASIHYNALPVLGSSVFDSETDSFEMNDTGYGVYYSVKNYKSFSFMLGFGVRL